MPLEPPQHLEHLEIGFFMPGGLLEWQNAYHYRVSFQITQRTSNLGFFHYPLSLNRLHGGERLLAWVTSLFASLNRL